MAWWPLVADVVDKAVAAAGRAAKWSDGKLPPHVMVYFAMALALIAESNGPPTPASATTARPPSG